MDEAIADRLYDQFANLFITRNTDSIEMLRMGFLKEDCSIPHIAILINCLENITLFNAEQINNISNIINKLIYV